MTPEERAKTIIGHVIERGGRDLDTIAQAIRAAVAEEREACAHTTHSFALEVGFEIEDAEELAAAIRRRGEMEQAG